MLRRALLGVVAFVCLAGCASHSSTLAPVGSGGVTPFVNQGNGQSKWLTFSMSQNVGMIAKGQDDALWLTGANQIVRVDMSGNEHDFSLNGSPNFGPITPNPNGNIYFAELYGTGYAVGQITPAGVVNDFPIGGDNSWPPDGVVDSMVSGSDGNIWMVRDYFKSSPPITTIARLTTTGQEIDFSTGQYQVSMIQRGPDKNLWVLGGDVTQALFMLKVSVVDGSYTAYPIPKDSGRPVLGADGAFWMGSGSGNMYRMDTSGNVTTYPTGIKYIVGPTTAGPNKKIYIYGETNLKLYEWSIPTKRITAKITGPDPRRQGLGVIAIGPDDQLWGDAFSTVDVLILHAILASPSSITVSAGSSTPLSFAEHRSRQRSFTAVSNDQSIATVSGSGESFTVTGVAPGTTTITVSDQIGNSLDLPVTVN